MPRKIDRKTADAVFHILAKYQAIETSRQGIRPDLPIEVGGEERYQLSSYDRLKAIAINRNLNRSNSKALSIIVAERLSARRQSGADRRFRP